MDINAIVQQHGVTGLMLIVFTLVMWNTSRSNKDMVATTAQQLAASMTLINTIVAQREKDRDTEASNRKEDIKRTEENFAQYESLVTTTAKNHALLAQNQTDSLALLTDMKSLLRIDAAALQRVEIKQQASSEVLDKHTMTLEEIVRQLGNVMRTLNNLETQITNLSTNVATKHEIANIQTQIQELKLEVAALAAAISALQHGKQDKEDIA